jgi:hypothetical protein
MAMPPGVAERRFECLMRQLRNNRVRDQFEAWEPLRYNFTSVSSPRRVAQLVRALGRHPRGRWFESNRAYQQINELDQKRSSSFFFCRNFEGTPPFPGTAFRGSRSSGCSHR